MRASRARGAMRAGDMRACGAREGTAEIQRRYSGEQASEYPKRGYTGYAAYTHPIGLERITACFLGIANVKECSMFPRDINRVAP